MSGFDVSYLTITTIEILYRLHFKVIAVTKVELLAASLFQMKFTQFIAVLLCNFILYRSSSKVYPVELLAMSEFKMKFDITISYSRQKYNDHR